MSTVAIVGAGAVGTAVAYAAQIRGVASHLALYDLDARKVHAEVMDLDHGLQFTPTARISGGDDLAVCAGADVVVVTAGARQRPGQTRLDLAAANVAMCRELIPALVEVAPEAVLLLVTNPVDVVTYAAAHYSGLPSSRVLGSGTVLDSSRLRFLLARATGVAIGNVHAYIAGEHGDSEVPLWSTARIGGIPVTQWPGLDSATRSEIAQRVITSAQEVIAGKGATNLAIGLAVSRILQAVLDDEHRVLPVSSVLREEHVGPDLAGICLSLPTVVSRTGVSRVLATPLSTQESQALHDSAQQLRSVVASVGLPAML